MLHLKEVVQNRQYFWQQLESKIQQNSPDSNGAIILAVIAMARSLKLEVIAEGVETELQKDFLKQNNCNIVQGYLFSRPVPYDDFCDLLKIK
jgi:EAL domain-containing protein (putative c-di-GMP-specific phosphodiesterase class I)